MYCRRCRRSAARTEFARIMDDVQPGTEPTPYDQIEAIEVLKHRVCNKPSFVPRLQGE